MSEVIPRRKGKFLDGKVKSKLQNRVRERERKKREVVMLNTILQFIY